MVRARVRVGGRIDAARRARLHGVLRRANLRPAGLPPGAVLLVRRAEVSLPSSTLAPWGPVAQPWESDARARLGAAMAAAERPAVGLVTPSAQAVMFADHSELLACLVQDLARGVAPTRWWWRTWLDTAPEGWNIARILGDDVRLLPSVLDTLDGWGAAAEVVGAIAPPESVRLLAAVAAAFRLPGPGGSSLPAASTDSGRGDSVDRAVATVSRHGDRRNDGDRRASASGDPSEARAGGASVQPCRAPPWADALGHDAVPVWLLPEQAVLLAVGLLVARAPRVARSPSMRDALQQPALLQTTEPTAARSHRRTTLPATDQRPPVPAGREQGVAGPAWDTAIEADASGDPSGNAREVERARAGGVPGTASSSPPWPPVGDDELVPAVSQTAAPGRVGLPVEPEVRVSSRRGDERGGSASGGTGQTAAGVRTELGGVFYLVNLVRSLGLPDVADPAWRLRELTGWALVDLLARGLLDRGEADRSAEVAADPVWRVLATLDGRDPSDPVGVELAEPLPAFRLPTPWADDLAEHGAQAIVSERGRPRFGPGAGSPRRVADALPGRVTAGSAGWLAGAMPYVTWRLGEALGEADPVDILGVDGRLRLDRTHLDVTLPLSSVSLAVRRAGLDRDPGWVPLLGRVVAFHFVEESLP